MDRFGGSGKELGLPVTQEQIDEMKAHQDDINYDVRKNGKRKSVTMSCLMYTLSASSARRRNRLFTWGYLLLCRGQYRRDYYDGGPKAGAGKSWWESSALCPSLL